MLKSNYISTFLQSHLSGSIFQPERWLPKKAEIQLDFNIYVLFFSFLLVILKIGIQ